MSSYGKISDVNPGYGLADIRFCYQSLATHNLKRVESVVMVLIHLKVLNANAQWVKLLNDNDYSMSLELYFDIEASRSFRFLYS